MPNIEEERIEELENGIDDLDEEELDTPHYIVEMEKGQTLQDQPGYINNLTKSQQERLDAFSKRLKDPKNAYHKKVYQKLLKYQQDNPSFYLRFLRARNFSKGKAMKLMCAYVEKHSELDLYNRTIKDVPSVINTDAVIFIGPDKVGRQAILIIPGRHTPGAMVYREVEIAFMMSAVICEMELDRKTSPTEHFSLLFAYKNWSLSNVDTKVDRIFMKVGQDCFPERLGKAYFVDPPRIFQGVWTLCKPFLDESTKSKFKFLGEDYTQELLKDFDEHVLPEFLGGKRKNAPSLYEFISTSIGQGTLGEYVEKMTKEQEEGIEIEDDDLE